MNPSELKEQILELVKQYHASCHVRNEDFRPGEDRIPYSGRVYDADEMVNLVDSSLDFWLTYGRYSIKFEKMLAEYLGVRYCSLVNSGSSANLVAFMALTSHKLGNRRIRRGDEVITVAAGFPTTIAPIVQYGAVPVFLDVHLETANMDCSMLEEALSPKTKAVMIAHTLGNPFELGKIREFCDRHQLWLIEDNCDALGSTYRGKMTGTFGDIGTCSFYPPHHITMGEGGAVYTSNPRLKTIIESIRDWGRDCWCESGKDNTCGKRFGQQLGQLPEGYDHKYTYSHFGYNLKVTDMQAAIGCAQMEKLPHFVERRKHNYRRLYDGLKPLEEYFILPVATEDSDPSWFGFLMTIKDPKRVNRRGIVQQLESRNIQTRMLFAGNIVKQPCFDEYRDNPDAYRIVGNLTNTDKIMEDGFIIGLYPGMTDQMIDYMIEVIQQFVRNPSDQ